jgi:major membrane immunogen (membrane-anchored lipoprotein)
MKKISIILGALVLVLGFTACSGTKDGTYTAKSADFDEHGYIEQVSVTIDSGKISAVNIDAMNAEGQKKSDLSKDGTYDMSVAGAQWPWHEQVQKLEAYLVANQGSKIESFVDGKTDAISGCTIAIEGDIALFNEAVAQASK